MDKVKQGLLGRKRFSDLYTLNRNSERTVYDENGKIVTVPPNQPGYTHDPVTGEPKGILIEETRTNLVNNSTTLTGTLFSGLSWSLYRIISNTVNEVINPSGLGSCVKIQQQPGETSAGSIGIFPIQLTGTYTFSIFAKANTANYLRIFGKQSNGSVWFDLENGSVGTQQSNVLNAEIKECKDGWYRCSATFEDPNRFLFYVATANGSNIVSNDGTASIYLWGAQLEEGEFPTSYIPTSGSAVTRAADIVKSDAATFGEWFNPIGGLTFAFRFSKETNETVSRMLFLSQSRAINNSIGVNYFSVGDRVSLYISDSVGTSYTEQLIGGVSDNIENALSVSIDFTSNQVSFSSNGGAVSTNPLTVDASSIVSAITTLGLGNRGGNGPICGVNVESFVFIPQAVSDSKLQELSSI